MHNLVTSIKFIARILRKKTMYRSKPDRLTYIFITVAELRNYKKRVKINATLCAPPAGTPAIPIIHLKSLPSQIPKLLYNLNHRQFPPNHLSRFPTDSLLPHKNLSLSFSHILSLGMRMCNSRARARSISGKLFNCRLRLSQRSLARRSCV